MKIIKNITILCVILLGTSCTTTIDGFLTEIYQLDTQQDKGDLYRTLEPWRFEPCR